MTGLVSRIRRNVSTKCVVNGRLIKKGCAVKLTNVPKSRVVVDFDKKESPIPATDRRCDYLIVVELEGGLPLVALLELKRGDLDADKVTLQLQSGASEIEDLVPKRERIKFCPYAVTKRKSRHEMKTLRKRNIRIKLHDYAEPIRLMRCGESLPVQREFESNSK